MKLFLFIILGYFTLSGVTHAAPGSQFQEGCDMMSGMGLMMLPMMLIGLLLIVMMVLAVVALVKYLRSK